MRWGHAVSTCVLSCSCDSRAEKSLVSLLGLAVRLGEKTRHIVQLDLCVDGRQSPMSLTRIAQGLPRPPAMLTRSHRLNPQGAYR